VNTPAVAWLSAPGKPASPGALLSPGVLIRENSSHRVNAPAMAGRSTPGEAASSGVLTIGTRKAHGVNAPVAHAAFFSQKPFKTLLV